MFDTIEEWQVWLIYFLPLASCLLIAAHYLLPKSVRPSPRLLGTVSIVLMLGSFLLSLWALKAVSAAEQAGQSIGFASHPWLELGPLKIEVGARVDGLTAIMLVVVTSVGLLVQLYSQGYMAGDPGYPRYYAFLSLFTAAMLGLVLGSSLIMVFIHWELVGLCSYLLIGFWFANPARPGYTSPAAAAKKAFVVTRFGDLGFMIAILLIWTRTQTFDIGELQRLAVEGAIGSTVLTLFCLGIFAGAAGKSAQFPFHTWLPDAMEGPTPVSALIHAATMVAAGVYLVARLFPVFSASDDAMRFIVVIGAITAVMAATMGMVMHDIKRVLAYSTISQLGYMMMTLGTGGLIASIFHLMNHAFFKALLFLGSGSVNHGAGTFDMRRMGGLRRAMPITFVTFVIGSLSLAGIPPLSGFWSKDEILVDAWEYNFFAFAAALTVAFMTAFYMFRAIFLTFCGEYRGGDPAGVHSAHDDGHDAPASHGAGSPAGDDHRGAAAVSEPGTAHAPAHVVAIASGHGVATEVEPHESPFVMWLPLVILAVPAVVSGFLNAGFVFGKPFGDFLGASLPEGVELAEYDFVPWIAVVATLFALSGILLAGILYRFGGVMQVNLGRAARLPYALFARKYYLDDLYETAIVGGGLYRGVCYLAAWFDAAVVDGAVNGAARMTRLASSLLRRAQTGSEQSYGLVLAGGVAVVVLVVFVAAL
ncbi:MAG: NADH-quinone oxidoreductase subunit L [Chloroflexi bacterium]|nr:NADH-quinone oxidoreductase subunit L [Chloroflexota bacterium]